MPLTLVKETGSGLSNANSYASVAEGDAYHDAHLYASAWTAGDTARKSAALVMATRIIDAYMEFGGKKSTSAQALQWPRYGCPNPDESRGFGRLIGLGSAGMFDGTVVPPVLVAATCETARELMAGDLTRPPLGEGLQSSKTSSERTVQELIQNGNFSTGLGNPPWIYNGSSATAIVAGGYQGNCISVANYGGGGGNLAQSFSTVQGMTYRLLCYFKKGTSSSAQVLVGTSQNDGSLYASDGYADANWTLKTIYFTAVGGTTWVTFYNKDTTAGLTSLWDEVSVQAVTDSNGVNSLLNPDLSLSGLIKTDLVYDRIGQALVLPRVAVAMLGKIGKYRGERTSIFALVRR